MAENIQQPKQGDGQQGGEIRRNRNHRRRHGGQGQGQRQQRPNDENRQQRQGGEKGGKGVREPKEKNEGRENKPRQEQGQRRKKQFDGASAGQGQIKREKRQRFIEDEREKEPIVKKVETIDDIRSDNARITKEIYQVIASMKDITIE